MKKGRWDTLAFLKKVAANLCGEVERFLILFCLSAFYVRPKNFLMIVIFGFSLFYSFSQWGRRNIWIVGMKLWLVQIVCIPLTGLLIMLVLSPGID